jgi:hypothetical protein
MKGLPFASTMSDSLTTIVCFGSTISSTSFLMSGGGVDGEDPTTGSTAFLISGTGGGGGGVVGRKTTSGTTTFTASFIF